MKTKHFKILIVYTLIALFITPAFSANRGDFSKPIKEEHQISKGALLELDCEFTNIKAHNWDKDVISIEINITVDAKNKEKAQDKFKRVKVEIQASSDRVYLRTHLAENYFKNGKDNTLDNLVTKHIVSLFGHKKEELTIHYKGYKGLLTYGVGNTSIIGNGFLVEYDDEFDFIVDVGSRGSMSLRANNKVSVSTIAKEWANGGGHPNASGGRIQGFKEQFRYDKVKVQIEKLIAQKEASTTLLTPKSEIE